MRKIVAILRFLRRWVRDQAGFAAHPAEEVHVDADEFVGVGVAHARGGYAAPVATLRAEALVAERAGHQVGEAVGDLLDAEAFLPGREGQAVARERGRDDCEGVGRITAERSGVGEARDDLEELEYRA